MSNPYGPGTPEGVDPGSNLDLSPDDSGPVVGQPEGGLNPFLMLATFVALGLLLFVLLNNRRLDRMERAFVAPDAAVQAAAWVPPPPLELPLTTISSNDPGPFGGLPTQVAMPPPPQPPPTAPQFAAAPIGASSMAADSLAQRRRAPAVVVDLGVPPSRQLAQADTVSSAAPVASGAEATSDAGTRQPRLTESEQFAERVGEGSPDVARATPMSNPRALAPQGTIIPGVLETAINSDLPGFTRAVVSRDVLSFDGRAVLIPRGSRLIGQYKSAVALGQSRAFIIWTRVIRPDGVSIQIGSPGTDALGRGGLDGDVDRHFFRRFSGSILLSVLNAAVASVGQTPSTQISIGSPAAASGLANSAMQGEAIPPTIKVAQGAAIRIFVARDLDFSGVAPIR